MFFEVLKSIAVGAVYSACAVCLGALILRLVARRVLLSGEDQALAVFASQFLLGQALLAAIWQLLALGGWFSPLAIVIGLGLSFLGGVRFALPSAAKLLRAMRSALAGMRDDSPVWWGIAALAVILVLMTGIMTVNPPQPRGDALAFYMALPKVIASSHRLTPLPGYEAFSQFSLLGELHFAALISLSGTVAAKLFVWPISLAVAAMLAALGDRAGLGRRGQWIVVVVLFTSTAFTNLIWNGKVDLFAAGMGLAAFFWVVGAGDTRDGIRIRLAGLSAGFAIVAKLSFLIPLVPGLVLIVIWHLRVSRPDEAFFSRRSLAHLLSNLFWLGFWTALPLLINVLKNTLLFGKPLAPFISGDVQRYKDWLAPETTRKILLTFPISLAYGQFWGQGGRISALFLAFLPLVALLSRSRSIGRSMLAQLTIAGLVGIALWHLYMPSAFAPRYVMPSLLLLVLPAARGAEYAIEQWPRMRLLSGTIIAAIFAVLLIAFADLLDLTKTGILRTIGRVELCDMEQYGSDASCRIAGLLNEEVEPDDRVFLAAYYRFWYRPEIIQCLNSTDESGEFEALATPEERWRFLAQRGYRYVVIDEITHGQYVGALDVEQLPQGLEVETTFEVWPFVVYRIDVLDPTLTPVLICAQVDPPVWEVIAVEDN